MIRAAMGALKVFKVKLHNWRASQAEMPPIAAPVLEFTELSAMTVPLLRPPNIKEITMTHRLTRDEFDALEQVKKMPKTAKPSACIARNAKHLVGIKYLASRKDGSYALTEKGTEALFIRSCIAGLRALATDADTKLDVAVETFLGRKGHIAASAASGRFEITQKGRECLTDIALNP